MLLLGFAPTLALPLGVNPGSITSLLPTASRLLLCMPKLLPVQAALWEEAVTCSPGESLQQRYVCAHCQKGMSRAKALPKPPKLLSNFHF